MLYVSILVSECHRNCSDFAILFGLNSGAAQIMVVGVLIEVIVMLMRDMEATAVLLSPE